MRALLLAAVTALALAPPAAALTLEAHPPRIGFAEPVELEARGRGPVSLDLGLWTALDAPRTATEDGATTVRQRVVCLVEACLPEDGPRRVPLPVAVAGTARAGATIVVEPRVTPAQVEAGNEAYRRDEAVAPPARHRGAVLLLGLAAAALLALAVALAVPRRRGADLREQDDPLARALRLLRESAARPAPDRRRAADLAGRVAPALAGPARSLAWSRPEPGPAEVEELAGRLEESR